MDIIQIPLQLIDEDTDQPRYQFDEAALQELITSIEELGLLSPIKVRRSGDDRYKIIYGNRRYKACQRLGKTTIPCIVSELTDERDIYFEQIAENLTRAGFSPIEEAEAFHKLLNDAKFSSSIKYLSSKLSKPESYIKNKCELLKFGKAVKKLIVSGSEIRKDVLTEEQLLPIKDVELEHRDPLALIIARDELPVSDVKKIAKLFKDPAISASTKSKLLYKSGRELIETWSVMEQNRAERARESVSVTKTSSKRVDAIAKQSTTKDNDLGEQSAKLTVVTEMSYTEGTSPLIAKLQQLHAILTQQATPIEEIEPWIDKLQTSTPFIDDVDSLIDQLENHLATWRVIREQVKNRLG
jgi:ParB family chromosome partitioning protein